MSGRRGVPGEGSPRTFIRPIFLRFPIIPLVAVGEKPSEYPQRNHWKMTTTLLAETTQMSETDSTSEYATVSRGNDYLRALFRRDKPE